MHHIHRTRIAGLALAAVALAVTTGAADAATSATAVRTAATTSGVQLVHGHSALPGHAAHVARPKSGVSPAVTGSWTSQSTEPVLYNYGLVSTGPIINPPANIPATAKITNVCWTWNYAYPHPAPGIWVYVYNNVQGFYDTSGNELGCTTLDNGEAANQQFEFGFASPTSTSGYYPAIIPPAQPSGPATVTVYYTS